LPDTLTHQVNLECSSTAADPKQVEQSFTDWQRFPDAVGGMTSLDLSQHFVCPPKVAVRGNQKAAQGMMGPLEVCV